MEKTCTKCDLSKPLAEFGKRLGGLQYQCRSCVKQNGAARYQEKGAEIRAQRAAYVAANPEKIAALNKRMWEQNSDKYKVVQAEWRAANQDVVKRLNNKHYALNGAEMRTRLNERRKADPEAVRAEELARRVANPAVYRAKDSRRRAQKLQAGGTFTASDVTALRKLQQNKCAACQCCIEKRYHVDHIEPLSRGGSNDKSNLQLLCPTCNLSKGARDPIAFMQSRGMLL